MSYPKFPNGIVGPLEEASLLGEINYWGEKENAYTDTSQHPRLGSLLVLRTVERTLYFQPTEDFPANTRVKFGATSPSVPVHAYTYMQSYWVEPSSVLLS